MARTPEDKSTILVVDDERDFFPMIVLYMGKILNDDFGLCAEVNGCDVIEGDNARLVFAINQAQALAFYEEYDPDLVITDFALSHTENALGMLSTMGALDGNLPVIIMTAQRFSGSHFENTLSVADQIAEQKSNIVLQEKPLHEMVLAETVRNIAPGLFAVDGE